MFSALRKLFRNQEILNEPFVDQVLGQFEFERGLGWKGRVLLENKMVEVVLGSDGEPPSEEMLRTARSWLKQWELQRPKIIEYIRGELAKWIGEPNPPVPERLELDSINILWRDKPATTMIYFNYLGDEIRLWHVTLHGFEPNGFAYDD